MSESTSRSVGGRSRQLPVRAELDAALGALRGGQPPRRREDGKDLPLGAKGARTRQRLLDAAGEVFAQHGYQASSVAMVTERAQVSLGTFYQYFRDRADVVTALVTAYVTRLLDGETGLAWDVRQGGEGLAALLHGYVEAYVEGAAFSRVWEEVSQTEPELAEVRRTLTRVLEQSVERQLRAGQRAQLIPRLTDPALTARALTAMTDRFCYLTYVADVSSPPVPVDVAAGVLTELWSSALRLTDRPDSLQPARRRSPG